ncbi:hypothetical protein EON82_25635 [bacterium]|nr:MAG: hypothetical protein EON82_25635 [bacterium]
MAGLRGAMKARRPGRSPRAPASDRRNRAGEDTRFHGGQAREGAREDQEVARIRGEAILPCDPDSAILLVRFADIGVWDARSRLPSTDSHLRVR